MKRTLQELTIKDPFMFTAVMSYPEQCRHLLEVVLDKTILSVDVVTEKTIKYHPDFRGVRLDVLAIEADTKRHYNVEMQVKDYENLPQRSRYYHSQMNMEMLLTGQDYLALPDTYVIFICDYDPVGKEKYRYSFCNTCLETGDRMNDGGHTIWLSTKGKNTHEVPALLVAFLKYVDNPEYAASDDDFIKDMDERVKLVKQNRRWEDAYMQFQEMLADERAGGKADAIILVLTSKGQVSDNMKSKIAAQKKMDVLDEWLLKACSVKTVEEFEAMI